MTGQPECKFLKTVRLDKSDEFVFERPADAGEWAVSGSFEFVDTDPADLTTKRRLAFAQGFLGLGSFGRSTVVSVASASEADVAEATESLAAHLLECYGAPDREAARKAAREEVDFMIDLCDPYPVNQLLLVEREVRDEGIHEGFRAVDKPDRLEHAKIWTIVPDDEVVT
ncbi:MAG: DUF6505 family protein [Alphaproteobacteria bacterium]